MHFSVIGSTSTGGKNRERKSTTAKTNKLQSVFIEKFVKEIAMDKIQQNLAYEALFFLAMLTKMKIVIVVIEKLIDISIHISTFSDCGIPNATDQFSYIRSISKKHSNEGEKMEIVGLFCETSFKFGSVHRM